MNVQSYADLWFKYQIWAMYGALAVVGLFTIATIIKIIVIWFSKEE